MSHVHLVPVNIESVVDAGPIKVASSTVSKLWIMVFIGVTVFAYNLLVGNLAHAWGAFYVNAVYFQGLALGGVMTTVIMQIVRAKWGSPIRRLAEANVAYLPVAFVCFLTTYFGKEHLFYWANSPMPGREFWMSPNFVYVRFAILFFVLYLLMARFVGISLRGDVGLARDRAKDKGQWNLPIHRYLLGGWKGAEREVVPLQRKLSVNGPVVVFFYAVVVSLFAFEMIMGQNPTWYSNLFGAFIFVSQIYIGWASLGLMTIFFSKREKAFGELVSTQQLWDLGKLTFGFCMLWGYMFWSQFLPQWYGNLPEETQWLILRTREFPWKGLAWVAFPMAFIIPFITLLSRDLKKNPVTYAAVCFCLMTGVWLDRYLIIMPEALTNSGADVHHIPLGFTEIGIFVGFLGAYLLCIRTFLSKFPFVPVSHPLTHGSNKW
jgi:hypothetical protein